MEFIFYVVRDGLIIYGYLIKFVGVFILIAVVFLVYGGFWVWDIWGYKG